jgi:hypothetical protein
LSDFEIRAKKVARLQLNFSRNNILPGPTIFISGN